MELYFHLARIFVDVTLDLYDAAFSAYRSAQKLIKPGERAPWIFANIGNLLSSKGLPSEACEYLERALETGTRYQYAHERLANALKKQADEATEFRKKSGDGKRQVQEAIPRFRPPVAQSNKSAALMAAPSAAGDKVSNLRLEQARRPLCAAT